jgi:hypothetical protein
MDKKDQISIFDCQENILIFDDIEIGKKYCKKKKKIE